MILVKAAIGRLELSDAGIVRRREQEEHVSTVGCVGVTNTSRLGVNNGIRETPGDHKEGDGCDPIP